MLVAIYVHVPFCLSKCHYCDFFSIGMGAEPIPESGYLQAFVRELERWQKTLDSRVLGSVSSVFFGGGTPSLLSGAALREILERLRRWLPWEPDCEVSLEMNPKTASLEKLQSFLEAGVNRISLGVQTLSEPLLAKLNRAHDAADALQGLEWVKRAGFSRFSADLMYGLPGQQPEDVAETLDILRDYGLEHLSAYDLILEEQTPFYEQHRRGRLDLPEVEQTLEMRRITEQFAEASGLKRYEISNYAVPGQECRHNQHYWKYRDYVGLGPGAVSSLRKLAWKEVPEDWESSENLYGWRVTNRKNLKTYENDSAHWHCTESEAILGDVAKTEWAMLGLRTREGLNRGEFAGRFGEPWPERFERGLEKARVKGWVDFDGDEIYLSEPGILFCNEVILELLT